MSETPAVKLTKAIDALEPFVRIADAVFHDGRWSDEADDLPVWGFDNATITAGDLRRARALLDALKEEGEDRV